MREEPQGIRPTDPGASDLDKYRLRQGDDYLELSVHQNDSNERLTVFTCRYPDDEDAAEAEKMVKRLNASDEHLGFVNYETWAADMHVNQEAEVQERWLEKAAVLRTRFADGKTALGQLAHEMEKHYLETWDYVLGTRNWTLDRDRSMIRDVGSIDRVDWREVAARLLETARDMAEHEAAGAGQ